MIKKIFLPLIVMAGLAIGCQVSGGKKFLIILQAGTESHEGMARAVHALLYTTELKEAGYDVVLVFDGAGTEWAKALLDPVNKLHPAYEKLEKLGGTQIICDF